MAGRLSRKGSRLQKVPSRVESTPTELVSCNSLVVIWGGSEDVQFRKRMVAMTAIWPAK